MSSFQAFSYSKWKAHFFFRTLRERLYFWRVQAHLNGGLSQEEVIFAMLLFRNRILLAILINIEMTLLKNQ